jgi:hypothetical protein
MRRDLTLEIDQNQKRETNATKTNASLIIESIHRE